MAKKIIVESKDLSLEEAETKSALENNGETVYYMPIEITNRDQLETLGITRDQCRTWRCGRELRTVHLTPCSKEVFTQLSRDLWAQQTQEYRKSRCMVPGKQKPLIRCPEKNKCNECPFKISPWNRQPSLVSLDRLMEVGHEHDDTEPMDQMVLQKIELQNIKVRMDQKDQRLFAIFIMVNLEGCNKTEIASKFNISRNLVRKLIDDMNKIIQQIRDSDQ